MLWYGNKNYFHDHMQHMYLSSKVSLMAFLNVGDTISASKGVLFTNPGSEEKIR